MFPVCSCGDRLWVEPADGEVERRFRPTTMRVKYTATPWMTGMSPLDAAVTAALPRPGRPKSSSITTADPSSPMRLLPATVRTVTETCRSACLSRIDRSLTPLARRLRTKSRPSTSASCSRVCLAITVTSAKARAATGSSSERAQPPADVPKNT
jgi:hypothetical protein